MKNLDLNPILKKSVTKRFFLTGSKETYEIGVNFSGWESSLKEFSSTYLHEDENTYLEAIHYERRINSYLLGRYSAKRAIAELIGENDLKKINISNGIFNQPIVKLALHPHLQISIAHCESVACSVAFDESILLGIDIEKISPSTKNIVLSELTLLEKDLILKMGDFKDEFVLFFWTAKESLSKILKTGLTLPLNILEINSIDKSDSYYINTFTNFFQYQTVSWMENNYMFSITFPKNLNIDDFKNNLKILI